MNKILLAALKNALDFELKGKSIYEQAADETKNAIVKRTFTYLAEQEALHADEIKKYIQLQKLVLESDQPHDIQTFFMTTLDEFKTKTKYSTDDVKAHETALELEKQSYDYYTKEYKEATDGEAKQLFDFLAKQEKAHYGLVKKTLDYIKDPAAFYMKDEDAIFEGG